MACARSTALALAVPRFGALSQVGAALALGLLLGVQPAAAWLQDWLRPPHHTILRGEWREPSVAPEIEA